MSRRGLVLALIGSSIVASSAAAAGPVPVLPSATVTATLSSPRPAARPVELSLSFGTALVCGRPVGPTTITLPAASRVPAAIPRTAVTIDGQPAATVSVSGSAITVAPVVPAGIMCHSVTLGPVAISFAKAAGLGNPGRSGTYAVAVRRGQRTLRGAFTIRG